MLDLRIGIFMGLRQIQHTSPWTTGLIILVILFTFINLIAVSGILIGIVDGAIRESRERAYGDILMKPLESEDRIREPDRIFQTLDSLPEIGGYSPRYTGLATIEADYKERRDLSKEPNIIAVTLNGVDPEKEDVVLGLSSIVAEGSYFNPEESGYILIGKHHIDRYAHAYGDVYPSLDNVFPGDSVRVTVGDRTEEFIVKGIINSKIDFVSLGVYIPEREFRRLFDRIDTEPNQIVVRAQEGHSEDIAKAALVQSNLEKYAEIKTFTENTPKYVSDVEKTFSILGVFVGAIGIGVASITIFIVIFIHALSKKRQIGILKAIGISERSIVYGYVVQSGFYTIIGVTLGTLFVLLFLVPYFAQHPIDFPYADVSLSISTTGIATRCVLLLFVTLLAGFVPAWLITRQNTINSILGRK